LPEDTVEQAILALSLVGLLLIIPFVVLVYYGTYQILSGHIQ
jgi:hypothetical protein